MKKYRVRVKYVGTLVEVFEAETEEEALKNGIDAVGLNADIIEAEVEEID